MSVAAPTAPEDFNICDIAAAIVVSSVPGASRIGGVGAKSHVFMSLCVTAWPCLTPSFGARAGALGAGHETRVRDSGGQSSVMRRRAWH